MTWNPKKGDTVKVVTTKSWGANRGQAIMIRRAKVIKVSAAGYISIDARPHDRFQVRDIDKVDADIQDVAHEWTPRKFSTPDYLKHITPISEAEADLLPDTDQGGREFARSLKPKET